jgi:endoglucanase
VLEPDGLAATVRGCASSLATQRYRLLSDAVAELKRNAATSVYIDAGNPGFPNDPRLLVEPLRSSGIKRADGFALNVSNFYTTASNVAYGQVVSAGLGGAHFIIDTSRNGAGPLPAGSGYGGPSWCNPPGRRLGSVPTVNPSVPYLDALLWIKTPGDSDGSCGLGDPPAGAWWANYALSLAG